MNFEYWNTSDLEQAVRESDVTIGDIIYQAEGYMSHADYREFLENIAKGVVITD